MFLSVLSVTPPPPLVEDSICLFLELFQKSVFYRQIDKNFIKKIIDLINIRPDHRYIKLLEKLSFQEGGVSLKRNQVEIVGIMQCNGVFKFKDWLIDENTLDQLSKAYHNFRLSGMNEKPEIIQRIEHVMEIIGLLATFCKGDIHIIESLVQSLLPYQFIAKLLGKRDLPFEFKHTALRLLNHAWMKTSDPNVQLEFETSKSFEEVFKHVSSSNTEIQQNIS